MLESIGADEEYVCCIVFWRQFLEHRDGAIDDVGVSQNQLVLDEAVYLEAVRLSVRALAVAKVGSQGAQGAYAITKLSSSSKSLARTACRMLLGRWMGAMYAMIQLCGGIGREQAGLGKECF